MDQLAHDLATQATQLGLSIKNLNQADPRTLREFVATVLEELAARGLIEGEAHIGCWAQPRQPEN